jgi:hypothetical protein
MLRGMFAALLIYAYGHPGLEVARPAALDAALQGFHREVNALIAQGYKAVARLDEDQAIAAVKGYVNHLHARARGKD